MTTTVIRTTSGALLALIGMTSLAAAPWGARMVGGVAAGGLWNLASLWCLVRLLDAWLGPTPSRRRALGWLFVKCPLLYALAWAVLALARVSPIGFGLGLTVGLVAAMTRIAWPSPRPLAAGQGAGAHVR